MPSYSANQNIIILLVISLKSQFSRSYKNYLWIINDRILYKVLWLETWWHDKTYTDIIILLNIAIHICESVVCLSGENLSRFFFFFFNICIAFGHSMIKTGRVIITLTGICHIYLSAPATFIYQHLPHLSTTTCISNVKCRSLFEFGLLLILVKLLTIAV